MTIPGQSAQNAQTLSYRALNRAMLERQLLLARASKPALETIAHLIGLQAQAPNAPYVGLWSRLAGFESAELSDLVSSRQAVRIPVMRGTIHLLTADDALALRPLTQLVLTRAFNSQAFARNLTGLDLDPVLEVARELAAERPLTRTEVVRQLSERWPGYDAASLGYAFTYLLPLVQVPPRGIWGRTGPVAWTPVQAWLGTELAAPHPLDRLILRYLAAFGPATVADIQTWSGLTRLREVSDQLKPGLRTFKDPAGNELLDLPEAPRPDEDTPAPPRFLPEYDNVLFSYADRNRVNPAGNGIPLAPGNGGRCGTVLFDGTFQATWQIEAAADLTTLVIRPFAALTDEDQAAVTEEARDLLAFATSPSTQSEIRITNPRTGTPSSPL
ncbi:MAG TPA: winged helix DNA-binding domain-containing protein [Streptosporangiaceae bacterium]|nr:winged helix DNA-binding domain-containing protein [Streptosporangiaceae bacterium]